MYTILNENALHISLPDRSIHCCITSPPYLGLRNYNASNQIGLESTPDEYVANLVAVFREVKRTLRDDGVVFLNLGDSYFSSQYSGNYAIIREDLTVEEIYELALGIQQYMPKLWRTCWQEASEGTLPEMLREEVQGGTSREDAGTRQKILSQRPQEIHGSNSSKVGKAKSRGDESNGREVHLLRGNRKDVFMPGSYQGERAEGLPEGGRPTRSLEESDSGGFTQRQISASLLELQFGIRFVRFLSSLKLDFTDIPAPVKIYFREASHLKPKDLIGIPYRVVSALQADGWYWRAEIPWLKRNGMPSSQQDRPTVSHEWWFLLSKKKNYYYDQTAILRPFASSSLQRLSQNIDTQTGSVRANAGGKTNGNMKAVQSSAQGRYYRTTDAFFDTLPDLIDEARAYLNHLVSIQNGGQGMLVDMDGDPMALVVNTKGYKDAHFATYPPDLVEPMIKASTSEWGCCPVCGNPWKRITQKGFAEHTGATDSAYQEGTAANRLALLRQAARESGQEYTNSISTLGWSQSCSCAPSDPIPCTVLDPFNGAGSTGVAALRLGRAYVGIEINPEYVKMSEARLAKIEPYKSINPAVYPTQLAMEL